MAASVGEEVRNVLTFRTRRSTYIIHVTVTEKYSCRLLEKKCIHSKKIATK